MLSKIKVVLLAAIATSGLVFTASGLVRAATAQNQSLEPSDTFSVNYFSFANTAGAPDAAVRVTNPGEQGSNGNLCANVYVFDATQELKECCSCLVTPNGLLTFSVNNNLTSNPENGVKPHTGVIKIVSGAPFSGFRCSPFNVTPVPNLRAWGTHVQQTSSTSFSLTEDEFEDSPLSSDELSDLTEDCVAAAELGSGTGICTCPRIIP